MEQFYYVFHHDHSFYVIIKVKVYVNKIYIAKKMTKCYNKLENC